MKLALTSLLSILIFTAATAQKKPLTIKDFDKWKRLESIKTSNNGKYVLYKIAPDEGNKTLVIHNLENEKIDSIKRVSSVDFTFGAKYVLATIETDYEEVRQLKLKKEKKENFPKDSLYLINLSNFEREYIDRIKSWKTPSTNGRWLAYLQEKPLPEPETDSTETDSIEIEKEEKDFPAEETKKEKKVDKNARTLVVMDLKTRETKQYVNVMEYGFSENGSICYFNSLGDSSFTQGVYVLNLKSTQLTKAPIEAKSFAKLCTDTIGSQVAFTFTEQGKKAKHRYYKIAHFDVEKKEIKSTIDSNALKLGHLISGDFGLRFSENGKRLFFGVNKRDKANKKDSTILAEEKALLDIWSHHDGRLQPQQLFELKRDEKRSIDYLLDIKSKELVQVGHDNFSAVSIAQNSEGRYAIISESSPYYKERSWESPWARDIYLKDLEKGTETLLFEKFLGSTSISPAGKYLYWFNQETGLWWIMNLKNKKKTCLNKEKRNKYVDTDDDHPALPGSYGTGGWFEDDEFFFLNTKFGFTIIDPTFKTKSVEFDSGKPSKTRERIKRITDDRFIPKDYGCLVETFNTRTKEKNDYKLFYDEKGKDWVMAANTKEEQPYYNFYTTSKNRATTLYRIESNQIYPELYIKKDNAFKRLSITNPQQDNFKWYKTKLVEYLSADGDSLQGILYMPENYDESKKYPMVVYFYERMSDYLNSYQTPRPSYSTISRSFYCSNDYFVFVPDIAYYDGEPGQSAFNCIIPGVLSVLQDHPFINPKKMALQGQSWGGYQTAHLITRSNLFACGMAGAPVSNMTSAYGGIRWGSGYNRAFQYEHGQSRIGGSLWEKPLYYIENSPLFFADRVETPLLIMHNDQDGAVPWYQGIEYFTALRRLEKPVWMLVYNKEDHNLTKRPNRVDLSYRMFGFFNYYLKDEPMPKWMEEGIPALEKGKYKGY